MDENGIAVRVGWRRPTPEERMNLRIERGPKAKPVEGQGSRTASTGEEMGIDDTEGLEAYLRRRRRQQPPPRKPKDI